ncbi:MAG: hypothetical protein ACJAX4_000937 [Clostridium sp.]|jgi:hypothetical protein
MLIVSYSMIMVFDPIPKIGSETVDRDVEGFLGFTLGGLG